MPASEEMQSDRFASKEMLKNMPASEETLKNMPVSKATQTDQAASEEKKKPMEIPYDNRVEDEAEQLLCKAAMGKNDKVRNYIWAMFLQLEETRPRLTEPLRVEKREFLIRRWKEANEENDYFNFGLRNSLIEEAQKFRSEDLFPGWLASFEKVLFDEKRLCWTLEAEKVKMSLKYAIAKSKGKPAFSYTDPFTW